VVELKDSGTLIGMCGLIKRDFLEHVDIGYAFLPQYRGRGYALEAARATLAHARALGITRLAGITTPTNTASIQLLEKLGLRFQGLFYKTPEDPGTNLYVADITEDRAAA
jgi:RimJ/RimL family protein N-acetyltransferase